MVHLGDPLEDLAWCSCELWRGGTPFAGAMVAPEELSPPPMRAASGRAVDAERMAFYRVLAVVKMIAIMLTGIRAFRDGRTPICAWRSSITSCRFSSPCSRSRAAGSREVEVLIPIERLIDGCMQTLREEVLPEVGFARGARAGVGGARRAEQLARPHRREAGAGRRPKPIRRTTRSAAAAARRSGRRRGEGAAALESALLAAPSEPPAARAAALREALADAIARATGGRRARPSARPCARTSAAQALRDVMLLKPSLLSEISKG